MEPLLCQVLVSNGNNVVVPTILVVTDGNITLFKFTTVLCQTDNIPQNIPYIQSTCEEYFEIMSVPHNIVDLNIVMKGIHCICIIF